MTLPNKKPLPIPIRLTVAVRQYCQPIFIYGLAIFLTLAVFFLRESLLVAGQRPLLILFMFPIIISALLGGFGPGLTATAVAAVCTALRLPPANSLAMAAHYDVLQWAILIVNGSLVSLLGVALHRVTRRDKARWRQLNATQEQLQHSEALFKSTFEQAAVGIALVSPDGHWLRVNRKLCQMVGYSQTELLTRTFQDITYPDDLQASMVQVQRILAGEISTYSIEKRYIHKNGRLVWINLTVTLTRKADAAPDYFIAVIEKINARKQAELALNTSERSYRSLFDTMMNGYAHCLMLYENGKPQDFVFMNVNKSFETLTGLKGVVGHRISELIPNLKETNPELFDIYGRVALSGQPERFESYVQPLGIWFSLSVHSPQKGYFVVVFDVITERKVAEARLRQQAEELLERNAELQRFNNAMVGRELNMIELKQQINALCLKLGQPPPYPLAFLNTSLPQDQGVNGR